MCARCFGKAFFLLRTPRFLLIMTTAIVNRSCANPGRVFGGKSEPWAPNHFGWADGFAPACFIPGWPFEGAWPDGATIAFEAFGSAGLYFDRVARRNRDHRHPGGFALADPVQGQSAGATNRLLE